MELLLSGGRSFRLPGDPDAFEQAGPGEYRFRDTTEVVVDPNLLTVWSADLAVDGPEPGT